MRDYLREEEFIKAFNRSMMIYLIHEKIRLVEFFTAPTRVAWGGQTILKLCLSRVPKFRVLKYLITSWVKWPGTSVIWKNASEIWKDAAVRKKGGDYATNIIV